MSCGLAYMHGERHCYVVSMRLPTTRWILGSILDAAPRKELLFWATAMWIKKDPRCNSEFPVRSHTQWGLNTKRPTIVFFLGPTKPSRFKGLSHLKNSTKKWYALKGYGEASPPFLKLNITSPNSAEKCERHCMQIADSPYEVIEKGGWQCSFQSYLLAVCQMLNFSVPLAISVK